MNNLSQIQTDAKADLLQNQLEQTLKTFESATAEERSAAIKQIDSFLEKVYGEHCLFWLKVRRRLERMSEGESMHPDAFQTVYFGGSSIFPQ